MNDLLALQALRVGARHLDWHQRPVEAWGGLLVSVVMLKQNRLRPPELPLRETFSSLPHSLSPPIALRCTLLGVATTIFPILMLRIFDCTKHTRALVRFERERVVLT
ncbi:hypothetical protein CPB83DRAFT_184615 [Crepidotus variabilis]|uniref:Uncharacterized protein n=1 Tax=Crepidotus variabilis TaxID=179855 RepID=A0A9P6E3C3_9AGAR|nr:hypothetical protein CPB83DRAFT_184615 [Crepidotus variabilis]